MSTSSNKLKQCMFCGLIDEYKVVDTRAHLTPLILNKFKNYTTFCKHTYCIRNFTSFIFNRNLSYGIPYIFKPNNTLACVGYNLRSHRSKYATCCCCSKTNENVIPDIYFLPKHVIYRSFCANAQCFYIFDEFMNFAAVYGVIPYILRNTNNISYSWFNFENLIDDFQVIKVN